VLLQEVDQQRSAEGVRVVCRGPAAVDPGDLLDERVVRCDGMIFEREYKLITMLARVQGMRLGQVRCSVSGTEG